MLLEFRVRNFRSFKDESVLSLIAATDKTLSEENTVATDVASVPRVVRSAVIYGANASGKSNLLRAIQLMRGVVLESASLQPGQAFNVQPFYLAEASAQEPTLFEITVLLSGVRYQYGFEFTSSRITAEWLLVYEKQKPQAWFERKLDENGKDVFAFSSLFTGSKRIWQDATRPNALFLSTAVQLNSDRLKPLFQWFADSLVVLLSGGAMTHDFSTTMLQSPAGQSRITSLMNAADIAITAISAEPTKGFMQSFHVDFATGRSDSQRLETEVLVPRFRHTVGDVSKEFELGDESEGTQKLFSLAGPLFDILERGSVLVIDELDRSLHPLLVRQIIQTFQDPTLNCRGAQLIFSTHDTAQLDGSLLRRDQIWFTEKRSDQSSELMPLMAFAPRKGEAFEKGYLAGRYGGVPILANRLLDEIDCGA